MILSKIILRISLILIYFSLGSTLSHAARDSSRIVSILTDNSIKKWNLKGSKIFLSNKCSEGQAQLIFDFKSKRYFYLKCDSKLSNWDTISHALVLQRIAKDWAIKINSILYIITLNRLRNSDELILTEYKPTSSKIVYREKLVFYYYKE